MPGAGSLSAMAILHQLSDGVRDADLTSAISLFPRNPYLGTWTSDSERITGYLEVISVNG